MLVVLLRRSPERLQFSLLTSPGFKMASMWAKKLLQVEASTLTAES